MPDHFNRIQTSKVRALIGAIDDLDTVLSQEPLILNSPHLQPINLEKLPPPDPTFLLGIQLQILLVLVLHFLILLNLKRR